MTGVPLRRAREWLSRMSVLNWVAIVVGLAFVTATVFSRHRMPEPSPLTLTGAVTLSREQMCYDLPVGGWTPAHPRCYETIVSVGPIVGEPWEGCKCKE